MHLLVVDTRCAVIPALFVLSVAACSAAGQDNGASGVGFRIVQISGGPKMAVWYPTSEKESPHAYSHGATGSVALNAAAARRQGYPLILFSHGWGGCGTQSVFLTEELARAGYVVAAPDHRDASCSVDGARLPRLHLPQLPFSAAGHWRESTYRDRRADLEKTLDWMLANDDFRGSIDPARIGAMGHSLGSYSVLGMAGAWDSWKDPRIAAVLALAPYVKPLLLGERLGNIHAPVMFQTARFDLGITPSLRGPNGAFAQSHDPKYYVELRGGNHFEWTNAVCFGHTRIEDCLEKRANPRLIVTYSVAFFDRYLKQRPEGLRQMDGEGLRRYLHSEATAAVP
jgi:predicted dienelactone hydrolase